MVVSFPILGFGFIDRVAIAVSLHPKLFVTVNRYAPAKLIAVGLFTKVPFNVQEGMSPDVLYSKVRLVKLFPQMRIKVSLPIAGFGFTVRLTNTVSVQPAKEVAIS